MEQRVDQLEKRVDKLEIKHDQLEKDFSDHEKEYAETKVYVKEIYKQMNSVSTTIEQMKVSLNKAENASTSKWELFWSKASWFLIAILVGIILSQLNLK